MNKTYLDKNLSRLEGRISCIEKAYNVFNLLGDIDAKHPLGLERSIKSCVEEVSFWKNCKKDYSITFDRGLFVNYDHADVVLKHYLFIHEVNDRRRAEIKELIDDENVIRSFR